MNQKSMKAFFSAAVIALSVMMTGCEKEEIAHEEPNAEANFIPQENKKFEYRIESDGEFVGIATQWVSAKYDSSGIQIYNLHTRLDAAGVIMNHDSKMFSLGGKTYTEISVPEVWQQMVQMLKAQPGVVVTRAELFGFPAWLTMENLIRTNSMISKAGPEIQGQLITYTNQGIAGSMEQILEMADGFSVSETVETPAGSFVCNRYTYANINTVKTKVGNTPYTSNGDEHITLWVAHGVGIVKQETVGKLVTVVVLPTGEPMELVTNTSSKMILEDIK